MAIYDTVKGNIVRQELQIVEAGQHYKLYSAKVSYNPENVEKEDFFRLCYGLLKKCDEISLYTIKKGSYEVCYKFIVTDVNIEEKSVTTKMLAKIDFLTGITEAPESLEVTTLTPGDVQKLINKALEAVSETITGFDTKLEELIEANQKYQTETDDQLEEIETKLEGLESPSEETDPLTTPVEE